VPTSLLYGATSADAMYVTFAVVAAGLLISRRALVAALGAVVLAVASFFSYALLAAGAWSALVLWRRHGIATALRVAALCALVLLAFYLALHVVTGFDPLGALEAANDAYYAPGAIATRRPYLFWLLGSPVAFLVVLGLPIAWRALRSLDRGEPTAIALAALICAAALLGFTKAETERIWLFMVPLACLAACASGPPRRLRAVLALLVAQAVGVQLLLNTIW
jgi:hypothetical protein